MSNTSQKLSEGFAKLIEKAGTQVKVSYFLQSVGSVWDDDVSLTLSGNSVLTSGIVFPLDNKFGSKDAILLEQGRIGNSDKKLYLNGSLAIVDTAGSLLPTRIGIGNNFVDSYSVVYGGIPWEASDVKVYQEVYIRKITGTGSLLGE